MKRIMSIFLALAICFAFGFLIGAVPAVADEPEDDFDEGEIVVLQTMT